MDWWTIPLLKKVYLPPDGCLEIVAAMACDTPVSWMGTILLGGLIDLSGAANAWKRREAASWFVCVCCLSVWSRGSLTLSFFFSLFFFSYISPLIILFSLFVFHISLSLLLFFIFFIYLSPYYFFLFFFEQARFDTFLKQGYSFGWLELAARRSVIFPTLWLLCESQVCNVGDSFWVCSNSKEYQSVQLMQSSSSRASYVPCSS